MRLTVTLSLVVGLSVLAGGVVAASLWAPTAACADPADDPVAEWDRRWEAAFKDSAATYAKLAADYDKGLESTAAYTRFRILRYKPEDPETRKFLGYVKAPGDGPVKWDRLDTRVGQINEMSDLKDINKTHFKKDLLEADRKVLNLFKGLANKAVANGAEKNASADAKWPDKAARAWEEVLKLDEARPEFAKDMDEAHAALKHPKYQNKYVTPFKLLFVKARDDRKILSQKEAATQIKPVDAVECDGKFVSAGLKGAGAKSAHFVINTCYGKDVALRLAGTCEKALNDLCAVYGFPESIKDSLERNKYNIIKNDQDEFRKFLEKGAGVKPAEVQRDLDAHFGGINVPGEYVSMSSGGADADDLCMNDIASHSALLPAQGAARAEVNAASKAELDEWLSFSIGYDLTGRILGTRITIWGTFGRYGEAIEPRPGEDKWFELARRIVQQDEDVPIKKLFKMKLANNDFKPQPTIKGWAFLQFLFEKDAAKAKKFVQNALASGSAAAVAAVYPDNPDASDPEKSMDKLDAEYREWILKGW